MLITNPAITPFIDRIDGNILTKQPISILQINLGRRCNLACNHCHVEASPQRTEELTPEICTQIVELIDRFPQIETVDLTGGAPELNYGFDRLVTAARQAGKKTIVRSNLSIYFEPEFAHLPEYCAQNQLRIVASLPCYLAENVDKMRGAGVFDASIRAIQWLNRLGYGSDPNLVLDFVYNPQLATSIDRFSLPPAQDKLERDYKIFLKDNFEIDFDRLFTITNLPIGRLGNFLQRHQLYTPYLQFLEHNFNGNTIAGLMCRNQLSIDYLGNVYDCDFNQMENLPASTRTGEPLTVAKLLAAGSLDTIDAIVTAPFCYGCTAGCGSSCGGALV
jgi:radical SAM/Cys-rich protein